MPDANRVARTYLNPVHARDFPDPFVLKFAGEYFAYCTGFWADGHCFGVMRSRDLVRWTELAGALEPLPGGHTCYWAPEVVYRDGKFLMYYSVGNETLMQVRVADAERPDGLFVDSGHRLTTEEFAIDPHVFTDSDGARYLFYATDFLTHTHVGTGTVADRMVDDFTLQGRPRPVTRARYDWQVYDPARKEKGGVRWHTVEGPFVLKRKRRYYEMFSGGNWQNVSYGVSYATSDRVLRDDEWEQHADGKKVLPILRTIPGEVVGPGHNSVVVAPDNRQLFCVYHRWTEQGRALSIDRLEFVGDALKVLGPTTTQQPAPNAPTFADFFDDPREEGLGDGWSCASGRWSARDGEARADSTGDSATNDGAAEARCRVGASSFVAEVTLRSAGDAGSAGAFGVSLNDGDAPVLRFTISAAGQRAELSFRKGGAWEAEQTVELSPDFDPRVLHRLTVEVDVRFARVSLDDGAARWEGSLDFETDASPFYQLSLFAEDCAAAFRGFTLTRGFADEFGDAAASAARGWDFGGVALAGASVESRFEGALLRLLPGEGVSRVGLAGAGSFELVLNLKVDDEETRGGAGDDERGESDGRGRRDASDGRGESGGGFAREYVIGLGVSQASGAPLSFALERAGGVWSLRGAGGEVGETFALPAGFEPREFQQFRFRREDGRVVAHVGASFVCEVAAVPGGGLSVAAGKSPVVLDAVRLTEIEKP